MTTAESIAPILRSIQEVNNQISDLLYIVRRYRALGSHPDLDELADKILKEIK